MCPMCTMWHLSHPVPAWLLQHLTRGQHLYLSHAWASKGKILLSCWHQRHKCSFNSIPQQKGLINLFRQSKQQTLKLGQNSLFRWKFDLTGSEERSKLTSQKKPCCFWKARDTIHDVNPLVVPYMSSAGMQFLGWGMPLLGCPLWTVISSKRTSAREDHHTGLLQFQAKHLEALVLPSRSAPTGSLH